MRPDLNPGLNSGLNLKRIQQAYSEAIYSADTQALESLIRGNSDFTTRTRVDIYRNNTLGTLKQTLADTFPVCEALVGKNYFKQLANAHVQKSPSTQRNLDYYGEQFPQTLKELIHKRDELQQLAYLADVAQLEWLQHRAYYAADREAFDFEGFSSLTETQHTQLRFQLAEDISLMSSPYPVYDIWMNHQNEVDDTDNINNEIDHSLHVDQPQQHSFIVVQRASWQPQALLIDEALYRLLGAIHQNAPLTDLTGLLERSPMDIATLIQQGMVTGFEIKDNAG